MQAKLGILSLITFIPLLGAILLGFFSAKDSKAIKYAALGVSIVAFVASLVMLAQFKTGTYHFQMIDVVPWMESLGIHYRMGVDGISVWLVVLTTFLTVIAKIGRAHV